MKEMRGYTCGNCGNLSDAQLQQKLRVERLKIGRNTLIEMGIDPDAEDEEEKAKAEEEEEERALAQAMIDATSDVQELFDSSTVVENITVEAVIPVKEPKETPKPPVPKPEPPKKAPEPVKETPKPPVPKAPEVVKKPEPPIIQEKVQEPKKTPEPVVENKKEAEPVGKPVDLNEDNTFTNYFNEEDQGSVNSDELPDIELPNDKTSEYPIESIELSDIDVPDVSFENQIESAESTGTLDIKEIIGDDENEYNDFDDLDTTIDDSDFMSNENEEEEVDETPEEACIIIRNKKYTISELTDRYDAIQNELREKLGFIPYDNLQFSNGRIKVNCKLCDNAFETDNIEVLLNDVITLDKESCVKYGLKFKGLLTISACPHCRHSILTNNFNKFYRKKVEAKIAQTNLHIVMPELYWYASPFASYTLEANGIKQMINYIDIRNKYSNIDMTKHELFTPRGDDTKSKATSVEDGQEHSNEGFFKLPKHDARHQFHFDAVDTSQESYYERQQEQAQSQMVFQKSQKFEKNAKTIAVLNGVENPFEREDKLEAAFLKTSFYVFVKELAEECNVKFKYQINQKTFEIPVVDFAPYEEGKPGFRLICADYNRNSMFNVPFPSIATAVPFSFRSAKITNGENKFKYSVLYSDSLYFRKEAAFNALAKYINPTILAYGGKRIQLEGNLTVQYTTYRDYLNEFNERYNPHPDGKAKNGELGILASWVSSKTVDAKDILETLTSLESRVSKAGLNKLENDLNMYMVASIQYIEQLNSESGRMQYIITDYTEIGSALIADGLFQCIRALLKEYYVKYPEMRDRSPYIIVELDPNNYTSPSIKPYIQRNSLVPMDRYYKSQMIRKKKNQNIFIVPNAVEHHLRYVYVQQKEFRPKGVECIRKDIRKFTAKSLMRTMPDEIRTAGLQMGIFNDIQRINFIQNMGFVYATQIEIREYFVNQSIVQGLLLDGQTLLLSKAVDPDSMFNTGGIVDSSDNSLMTINNPLYNPLFRAKMDRIRCGNVTPEAADFYRNFMAQKQQETQQTWNYQPNQNAPPNPGVWQNPQQMGVDPTMTPGAYYMPHFPGMN
jgi:hypothetical protein